MEQFFRHPKTKDSALDQSRSEKSRPEGDTKTKRYRNYYDIDNTITTAQSTNPNDPDHSNYNREQVFVSLERNAERLTVTNDAPLGGATLFVIVSHSGGTEFSRERPIYPHNKKTYYNVYEIRLRSTTSGLPYRVTEYDIIFGT